MVAVTMSLFVSSFSATLPSLAIGVGLLAALFFVTPRLRKILSSFATDKEQLDKFMVVGKPAAAHSEAEAERQNQSQSQASDSSTPSAVECKHQQQQQHQRDSAHSLAQSRSHTRASLQSLSCDTRPSSSCSDRSRTPETPQLPAFDSSETTQYQYQTQTHNANSMPSDCDAAAWHKLADYRPLDLDELEQEQYNQADANIPAHRLPSAFSINSLLRSVQTMKFAMFLLCAALLVHFARSSASAYTSSSWPAVKVLVDFVSAIAQHAHPHVHTLTQAMTIELAVAFVCAAVLLFRIGRALFAPLVYSEPFSTAKVPVFRKRHAAPPYPTGWFKVADARDLQFGQVRSLKVFGQELVLFRSEKSAGGHFAVMDAFCPHLGANLSVGGKVKGDCIECPFHGWQFSSKENGKATCIPYAPSCKIPSQAKLRSWPVRVVDDAVLIWHDADGGEPSWEPQGSPLFKNMRWHGVVEHLVSAHCQRAKEQESKQVDNRFSKIGTQLSLVVARFLDVRSLAALARSSRFLRLRMTLSLKDTPSPALVSVGSLRLAPSTRGGPMLSTVLERVVNVESLSLDVPTSLLAGLQALSHCTRLEKLLLNVFVCIDSSMPIVSIPSLKTLKVEGSEARSAVIFVRGLPNLTSLTYLGNGLTAAQLQHMPLTLLSHPNLYGQSDQLPQTLTSLSCGCTLKLVAGSLPALRHLELSGVFFKDAKRSVRLVPQIRSLRLPFLLNGHWGHCAEEFFDDLCTGGLGPNIDKLFMDVRFGADHSGIIAIYKDCCEQLLAARPNCDLEFRLYNREIWCTVPKAQAPDSDCGEA